MLRTAALQPGSGIQDLFFRTPPDSLTTDTSYRFPQVHASRIWVMGYGICVNALDGTSVRVDVRARTLGNLGGLTLESGNLGAGYFNQITGPELTAVGWRAFRATPEQKFLAELIGGATGFAAHDYDTNENGEVILEIQKTTLSVFDGFAWLQLRVFKSRDDTETFGTEKSA